MDGDAWRDSRSGIESASREGNMQDTCCQRGSSPSRGTPLNDSSLHGGLVPTQNYLTLSTEPLDLPAWSYSSSYPCVATQHHPAFEAVPSSFPTSACSPRLPFRHLLGTSPADEAYATSVPDDAWPHNRNWVSRESCTTRSDFPRSPVSHLEIANASVMRSSRSCRSETACSNSLGKSTSGTLGRDVQDMCSLEGNESSSEDLRKPHHQKQRECFSGSFNHEQRLSITFKNGTGPLSAKHEAATGLTTRAVPGSNCHSASGLLKCEDEWPGRHTTAEDTRMPSVGTAIQYKLCSSCGWMHNVAATDLGSSQYPREMFSEDLLVDLSNRTPDLLDRSHSSVSKTADSQKPRSKDPLRVERSVNRRSKVFKCQFSGCGWTFAREYEYRRHSWSIHENRKLDPDMKFYRCTVLSCKKRDKIWRRLDKFKSHLTKVHKMRPEEMLGHLKSSERSSSQERLEFFDPIDTPTSASMSSSLVLDQDSAGPDGPRASASLQGVELDPHNMVEPGPQHLNPSSRFANTEHSPVDDERSRVSMGPTSDGMDLVDWDLIECESTSA